MLFYRNYGFNENIGDSTTKFTGDFPRVGKNIRQQYLTNYGQIKVGYIVHSFGQNYTCIVTYENGTREAIWLSQLLGGFDQSFLVSVPSEYSQVLLYEPQSGPLIILGVIPTPTDGYGVNFEVEPFSYNYKHLLIYNETDSNPSFYPSYNSGRPIDLFPGETAIISDLGNLIAVLKGVTLLKGTDLCQIQCCLLDNLLRIVGYTYEEFSSLGEVYKYIDRSYSIYEEYNYYTLDKYFQDYSVKEGDKILELQNRPIRTPDWVQLRGKLINGKAEYYHNNGIIINSQDGFKYYHDKEIEFYLASKLKNPPVRTKPYYQNEIITLSSLKPYKYIPNHSGEQQDIDKFVYDNTQYNTRNFNSDSWEIKGEVSEIPSAWVKLRKNGSVILRGQQGNFIELTSDGKIIISAPNDIELRTGGRTLVLSKETFTIRSQEDVEMVTSNGKITIKAQDEVGIHSDKNILIKAKEHYKTEADLTLNLFSKDNINLFAQKNIICHATNECRTEATQITEASSIKGTMGIIPTGTDITASPNTSMQTYEINATNINIMGDYSKEKIVEEKHIDAKKVKIEGQEDTTIYGGGTLGTNVNHTHIASEMIYGPDSAGGEKVITIQKQGAYQGASITPMVYLLTELLMSPYLKNFLESLLIQFTNKEGKQLDEHYWQKHRETVWNLMQDILNGTMPQPNNDRYYQYQNKNFIEKPLSEYKT